MTMKFQLAVVILVAATVLQSSTAKTVHVVGGSMAWTIPPGSAAYTSWAASNTFTVGDSLVFNFANGMHDVAEVTKADYDACNSGSPITIKTGSPANFTLNSAGQHFFICTFGGHCNFSQKLAIDVSAPPSPTPVPAPAPRHAGPAPRGPVTYTVGDNMGWTVPPQGAAAYQAWASSKTFTVGDILVFNFIDGTHDVVAEVTKSGYDSCNTDTAISYSDTPPVRITLTIPGMHYFACTVPGHCFAGQQLAITVATTTSSAAAPPPSGNNTPPSSKASPPPSTASSPPPSSTGSTPPPSTASSPPPSSTGSTPPPSTASNPPPSSTGSAPPPSIDTAPSPSKSTPPPSYITSPPSASMTPTPAAQYPSGASPAPGPSPPLSRNAAASLNANRFSTTTILSQLGIVLTVGFVQQLFM